MANDWQEKGFEVDFVLMRKEGDLLSLVNKRIRIISLNASRIRGSILPAAEYMRFHKPDVIWVGLWPLTSACALSWLLAGRRGKLYITEHINHTATNEMRSLFENLYQRVVMGLTYRLASGVIGVSKGVVADVFHLTGLSVRKVAVINNPVVFDKPLVVLDREQGSQLWGEGCEFRILAVGTLKRQKNFELLIRAFSMICHKINAKLVILGEGELRGKLEEMTIRMDLESKVYMPGFVINTVDWFSTADLFVLSSDWEGLPTVLIEALHAGCKIVSTDCPSGPAEILDNGKYGTLVPVGNVESLAMEIENSVSRTVDKASVQRRAGDFSIDRISNQYLAYFGLI